MSNFVKYKDESRKDWGTKVDDGATITGEKIQLGAILRIADATELMAKNHEALQRDLNFYKERYDDHRKRIDGLNKEITALKIVKTRYKNQLATENSALKNLFKILYCAVCDVDIYDDQDRPGMSIKEVCDIGSKALAAIHPEFDAILKKLNS